MQKPFGYIPGVRWRRNAGLHWRLSLTGADCRSQSGQLFSGAFKGDAYLRPRVRRDPVPSDAPADRRPGDRARIDLCPPRRSRCAVGKNVEPVERTHVAISQLIDRINRGEIKLPEIQRAYVWKPAQVAHLVDSLYRRYPSGAMLLWRPTEEVLERVAAIGPGDHKPVAATQYLLDGQQRLTSLHRVFKRHPDADIVFNVDNERFQVQSAATGRDPRWVRVADVINLDKLSHLRRRICEEVAELDEDEIDDRLGRLRGISKYEYYLEILTDLSYDEVAQIFVRVNSKGRSLKTVDLTLATLSARWPGVVGKVEKEVARWEGQGWPRIDATFVVRALAASATDAGTLARLSVTPEDQLVTGWDRVKHGITFLVQLLRENAGIATSNLIPSMNALVPLVALLGRFDSSKEFTHADALVYWLLAVSVTGRFSSAADTKIAQDALAARAEDPVQRLYENAGLLGRSVRITPEQLVGKGAGSPFFLLSYLVCKQAHAKDWWHDVEISETGSGSSFAIEYHHVHPQKTLRASYSKGEINDLANLAFISATANKKISDRSPADYFPELHDPPSGRDDLSPHFVPLAQSLRDGSLYREFLHARRHMLAEAMSKLLESLEPHWVTDVGRVAVDESKSVSITLFEGPASRVVFEAQRDSVRHVASAALSDLERFLTETADGVTTELPVGSETAIKEPEDEDVVVPVGPFLLTGSLGDWLRVLQRERGDARPISELGPPEEATPHVGERVEFPIINSD